MSDFVEEWKPVVGFEGVYEVSTLGRIKRIKPSRGAVVGRILKPMRHSKGYPTVDLQDDRIVRRSVHQIVAAAFIGPCPPRMEVHHRDNDKGNPAATNLFYGTHKRNIADAAASGLFRRKLSHEDVRSIRSLAGTMSVATIARQFNISWTNAKRIITGMYWYYID